MTVNIRYKAPSLPKDLDQYAVKSEDRAIGVLMRQIEDKAGGYLPIKIWASADPQAKLVGEVPSGFFAHGLTTSTVYVQQFFERPDPRLPLNVGVMGENSGNSDKECNLMRGVRYVRVGQADACIGYNNALATELKILLQRPGEIRVQRVILRRP